MFVKYILANFEATVKILDDYFVLNAIFPFEKICFDKLYRKVEKLLISSMEGFVNGQSIMSLVKMRTIKSMIKSMISVIQESLIESSWKQREL